MNGFYFRKKMKSDSNRLTFCKTDSLSFSRLMILMATFFPATQCTPNFTNPIYLRCMHIELYTFIYSFTEKVLLLTFSSIILRFYPEGKNKLGVRKVGLTRLAFPEGFIHSVGAYILTRIYTATMVISLHCADPDLRTSTFTKIPFLCVSLQLLFSPILFFFLWSVH